MALNTTYTIRLKHPFIAREAHIRKLADLLVTGIGEIQEIQARCIDDGQRHFDSVDDLLAYENANHKRISGLRLSAHNGRFDRETLRRGTIELSVKRWDRGISIDLDAPDDVAMQLRDSIHDVIEGMRPKYAILHKFDFALVLLAFMILAMVVFVVIYAITQPQELPADVGTQGPPAEADSQSKGQQTSRYYPLMGMIILLSVPTFFAIAELLNQLRNWLFPVGVFCIGQGADRFKRLERIHWGVLMALIVSIAGTALFSLL